MALTDDTHDRIKNHLAEHVEARVLAIDTTCGKGTDTLFLLGLGFEKVLAFDIQAKAVELTQQRLREFDHSNAEVIQTGHENMEEFLSKQHESMKAQCIMFNLGYLPTADKNVTTEADTTIAALNAALRILSPDGIISVMCYPGHPAGAIEKQAVEEWLDQLGNNWQYQLQEGVAPKPTAPILYLIQQQRK